MENAVVYARYSSHNQTEQSIEGQLAAARKYAEANNYTIIKEYCDRAKTGTNDDREAFQEMLHDCQSHMYSGLLAKKQVSQKFKLTRERIELFLRQFVSGNIADVNSRKRIVSVLVNRIFLYNEKIVIALNYSDESSTITVENIEKEYASVRPCVPEQGLAHSRRTLTCRKEGLFIEIRR